MHSLKRALQEWIENNGLAEDTFWEPETKYIVLASGPDLVLTFEGDLHSVLWCRAFNDCDAAHASLLRQEFDAIVKHHGFSFEFKNETTGHFYERR